MSRVYVFHNRRFLDCDFLSADAFEQTMTADDLRWVATIEYNNKETRCSVEQILGEAFAKTHSEEDVWWKGPQQQQEQVPARSTSAGDVLMLDGAAYRVCMIGFERWEGGDMLCRRVLTAITDKSL